LALNLIAIDDEFQLKVVYEYMFRSLFGDKINFFFYEDPNACLNDLEKYQEAIIFSDINMPSIDGFELAKKIKAHKPDWPIFLVSARDPKEYTKQAIDIGVNGYFIKPIDFDIVQKELEKFL
jgi:PleD family two-component response regulator